MLNFNAHAARKIVQENSRLKKREFFDTDLEFILYLIKFASQNEKLELWYSGSFSESDILHLRSKEFIVEKVQDFDSDSIFISWRQTSEIF